MNSPRIVRITGARTGSGDITWDSDGSTVSSIDVAGGVYLLIASISITLADLNSDTFSAEWSMSELRPKKYEYYTNAHNHSYVGTIAAGPRLVYQTPCQWWSSGVLPAGSLSLAVSHSCSVLLQAIRFSESHWPEYCGIILKT